MCCANVLLNGAWYYPFAYAKGVDIGAWYCSILYLQAFKLLGFRVGWWQPLFELGQEIEYAVGA